LATHCVYRWKAKIQSHWDEKTGFYQVNEKVCVV
jgi:hypothetical protein